MKLVITEKQLELLLSKYAKDELDEQDATSAAPSAGTSDKQSGGQGYPQVTKWESGVTRGPGNPVGNTKWSDSYKITRGKANPLNEQGTDPYASARNFKQWSNNNPVSRPGSDYFASVASRQRKDIHSSMLPTVKGMSLDEFMEKFREKLYSPGGMAVEIFLTDIGIGAPVVMGTYAVMLGYDIYKSYSTGSIEYGNIVFDLLGLVSSGVLSGIIAPIFKGAGKTKDLEGLVTTLEKDKKTWVKIKPFLLGCKNFLNDIIKWLRYGVEWIVKTIPGAGFIGELIGTLIKTVTETIKLIYNFVIYTSKTFGTNVSKVASKLGASEKVADAAGNSGKIFVQQSALLGGLHVAATTVANYLQNYLNKKKLISGYINVEDSIKNAIIADNGNIFSKNDKFTIVKKDKNGYISVIKINEQLFKLNVDNDKMYIITPIK